MFGRAGIKDCVNGPIPYTPDGEPSIDITSFSKFRVSGPGAEAALDRVLPNRRPRVAGRIKIAHALTETGGVRSEFTVLREGPETFYLVSSGAAERYDRDFLLRAVAGDGVTIENITTAHGVLVLAVPRSRYILAQATDADLSNEALPWLTAQPISIDLAPATAMRVNLSGEFGWELHHPIEYQNRIFDALVEAGEQHRLGICVVRRADWTPIGVATC